MIYSMTGFGKATGEFEQKKITVEIRTLNSKHTDISVRMPNIYREKELNLRSAISEMLNRGKIDYSLSLESAEQEQNYTLNKELAQKYHQELKAFSAEVGDEPKDYLSVIMRMPEVMNAERPELSEEEWKEILVVSKAALENVQEYRREEGKTLEDEFKNRIGTILSLLDAVKPYEDERVVNIKERIGASLEEVVSKNNIDKDRLEQEMIFYIEKLDITEEKVRLKSNCEYFLETMEKEAGQGKKLGFITQEIGREVNTLGAKANHAELQKIVVQMKDELEKVKEQIANVL